MNCRKYFRQAVICLLVMPNIICQEVMAGSDDFFFSAGYLNGRVTADANSWDDGEVDTDYDGFSLDLSIPVNEKWSFKVEQIILKGDGGGFIEDSFSGPEGYDFSHHDQRFVFGKHEQNTFLYFGLRKFDTDYDFDAAWRAGEASISASGFVIGVDFDVPFGQHSFGTTLETGLLSGEYARESYDMNVPLIAGVSYAYRFSEAARVKLGYKLQYSEYDAGAARPGTFKTSDSVMFLEAVFRI